MGIITRAAIGLDDFRGGSGIQVEGHSPKYSMRLPQETNKVFVFKYEDLDKLCEAIVKIGKAEIAFFPC